MAGLLDGQPEHTRLLDQQPVSHNLLDRRAQALDRTAQGQALTPQEVAAQDLETTTFLNEARKGLRRFGFSTIATTQAFAGSLLAPIHENAGNELIKSGLRTMEEMPNNLRPAVENWGDINDARSGALKLGSALGEGLPSSGIALGAGLAGRGVGMGAAALRGLRGPAADAVAARAGFATGTLSMLPPEGGETALDLAGDPVAMANTTPAQRAAMVLGRGAVNAAAENVVPNLLVAPRLIGKAARIQPGLGAGLRNTGLIGAEGALGEYGTEFGQELTGQFTQRLANPDAQYDLAKAHEAGLSGAVVGGVLGGAGGAAQSAYSNVAPLTDKAGELVGKVRDKLPGMPTFDGVLGTLRSASEDPEGAGHALANGTIEAILKAGEAAGALKPYAAKGLDTAESVASNIYDRFVGHAKQYIKDPDNLKYFQTQAARLKTMAKPEWDILKDQLSEASKVEFQEAAGYAATSAATRGWEGAKEGASWLGKVAKGIYRRFSEESQTGRVEDRKPLPSINEMTEVRDRLFTAAPGLKADIEQLAPKAKDKVQLFSILHHALDDPTYFTSATDPARQAFLENWAAKTGTDFGEVVQAVRDNRNDVTLDTLAGMNTRAVIKRAGLDQKYVDYFSGVVQANGVKTFEDLEPGTQALITSAVGGDAAKAADTYNRIAWGLHKTQLGKEGQLSDAAGGIQSQIGDLSGVEAGDGTARTTAAPTSDSGGFSGTTRRKYDELGNPLDEETETRSPFDQDVFKRIMTSRDYHGRPETTLPVSIRVPGGEVTPLQVVQALGERITKKGQPDTWGSVKPGSVRLNKDKSAALTAINPMSLARIIGHKDFRDQFAPHIAAFDQRPDMSLDEFTAQRFVSMLGELGGQGLHLDPEFLGLPKDHPLVHVKLGIDFRHLKDHTILNQDGKKAYTWGDFTGEAKRKLSQAKQLDRLQQIEDFAGSAKKLYESDDPLDKHLAKIAWARAIDKLKQAAVAKNEDPDEVGAPSDKQRDAALKEYAAALPQLLKDRKIRDDMQGYVSDVRLAYFTGELSSEVMNDLIAYYSGDPGINFVTQVQNPTKTVIGHKGFSRKRHDTGWLAAQLEKVKEGVDERQTEFEDSITGANLSEAQDKQTQIENDFITFKGTYEQKTHRERLANLNAADKKQWNALTKKQQRVHLRAVKAALKAGKSKPPIPQPYTRGEPVITDKTIIREYPPGVGKEEFAAQQKAIEDAEAQTILEKTARQLVLAFSKKLKDVREKFVELFQGLPDDVRGKAVELAKRIKTEKGVIKKVVELLQGGTTKAKIEAGMDKAVAKFQAEIDALLNQGEQPPAPAKTIHEKTVDQLVTRYEAALAKRRALMVDYAGTLKGTAADEAMEFAQKITAPRSLRKTLTQNMSDGTPKSVITKYLATELATLDARMEKFQASPAPAPVKPKDVKELALYLRQRFDNIATNVENLVKSVPDGTPGKAKLFKQFHDFKDQLNKQLEQLDAGLAEELKTKSVDELRKELDTFLSMVDQYMDGVRSQVTNLQATAKKYQRYLDIEKAPTLDKISFTNGKDYSHADLTKLVNRWVKKYIPKGDVAVNIFQSMPGDGMRGFTSPHYRTIYITNNFTNPLQMLSTLSHEFGHQLQYQTFDHAPQAVKDKIYAQHAADMQKMADGPLSWLDVSRLFTNAGYVIGDVEQKGLSWLHLQSTLSKVALDVGLDGMSPDEKEGHLEHLAYLQRFEEWFANQFNKYAMQGVDPNIDPYLKNFWTGLVDSVKQFFNDVVKKLTPSAEFEKWIKSLDQTTVAPPPPPAAKTASSTPPPPKPPEPPPPGGAPPEPPEPPPLPDSAKKRFRDIVFSMMGDKKIRVRFDQKITGGVNSQFTSKRTMLAALARDRVILVDALKDARGSGKQRRIDKLTEEIEQLDQEEKELLTDVAVQGFIDLAPGMEDKAGLAEHKTFEAAFEIFFDENERRILGQAFTRGLTGRRLREIFKDNPEVLKEINAKPAAAAAYAFEIWAADPDQFQLGPQVKNLFDRFLEFVRKLFDILTLDEKAQMIMENLKSGNRYQTAISPVAAKLDKDMAWQDRALKMAKDVGGLLESGFNLLLQPAFERIVATENPALTKAAMLGYEATGEEGNEGGMVQRGRTVYKKLINQLEKIFHGLSEDELKEMHRHMVFDTMPTDQALADRTQRLKDWYKEMYDYQIKAGVLLNNAGIKRGYYPLTWNPEKVLKNKKAFIDMLAKYEKELLTTKKSANEIYNSITGYIERGEDLVNVMGVNMEPLSESTKARTLGFISKEDRLPFMEEDPVHTAFRYAKQAVRQSEYVRSYGAQSSELERLKTEARTVYGASAEDLALLNDYIDGLMGNKEIGMSRELKDLYGAMNVYQNYRLLPFSLFPSLIDPVGIAIRSGSMTDAWNTFAYSMKNLFKEWKSEYKRDFWETLAEDWGIIEQSGTTTSATNLYDGITLRGTTKELNDKLFKYNLLNGWIRNNTIMATKAAQRFIYRASEGQMGEHSARYLTELGLTKDDIVFNKQADRILLRADELQASGMSAEKAKEVETRLANATEKFVRQALLNPSSAELPNWASNPYLLPIAHLKSFVFAFNMTIMNRIIHEYKHGNYKPIALAAAYVPGMIAADFLKDMIAGFGEEPPYKKDWGLYDYFKNGVERSGLTGVGQFMTSAGEDIMRGGDGYESWAGPAAQQFKQGVSAFGSGNDGAIKNWIIRAAPLNAAYRQHLSTSPETTHS